MRFLLILFLTLVGKQAFSQLITVWDSKSQEPIPGVLVFKGHDDLLGSTNRLGQLFAEELSNDDTLTFKLFGFRDHIALAKEAFSSPILLEEVAIDLDEVVVSSNRWSEEIKYVPQQIKRITPAEIKSRDPMTTADALASTGQVFVQKSQLGGGSPMLRGFSANKILLSIDGVRMNNAIYRAGNIQSIITLDANSLDNMEVVYGPGSVIYGSDALGGVIAMNTRNPEYSLDSNTIMYGGGFFRFSSANFEKTVGFDLNIGRKKWASFTQLTFSDFEDLYSGGQWDSRDPDFGRREFYVQRFFDRDSIVKTEDPRQQIPSRYRQANVLQKFKFLLSPKNSLDLNFIYSNSSDIPRYDRLTLIENDDPVNAEWYYGPQTFFMSSIGLNLGRASFFEKSRMTIAYQRVIESRNDRKYQSDFLRKRKETVDIISLNADFQEKLNHRHEFNYGIEGIYNRVSSEAETENIVNGQMSPASTRYPDGGSDYYSAAAYLNYIYKMSRGLTLNSGARFTYVGLDSEFDDTTFYNFPFREISLSNGAFSGSVGLKKQWESRSNVYMNLGTGFRAPNLDDVAKVFDSEPGNVVVPNPDLKPEYVISTEIGFNKVFTETFAIRANIFYSWWIDAIIRAPYSIDGQDSIFYDGEWSGVFAEQNLGEAQLAGAYGQIEWHPFSWGRIISTLTYTWGETRNGMPLRHVPPVFGKTTFQVNQGPWVTRLDFDYSGGIAFEDLAPSEKAKTNVYSSEGALSWWIMSLSVARKIQNKADVQLIAENLLDRHYRPYSSGISAPGLNIRLSARIYF